MTHLSNADIKRDIARRTPAAAERGSAVEFMCSTAEEFEDVIREDVEILKREEMLEGMRIVGMAFVTETGELREVC
jgi:hypothetical protein